LWICITYSANIELINHSSSWTVSDYKWRGNIWSAGQTITFPPRVDPCEISSFLFEGNLYDFVLSIS
jgi:hypothetical protein